MTERVYHKLGVPLSGWVGRGGRRRAAWRLIGLALFAWLGVSLLAPPAIAVTQGPPDASSYGNCRGSDPRGVYPYSNPVADNYGTSIV